MQFAAVVVTIIWLVFPFVFLPAAREMGLPRLIAGLAFTSVILAGLSAIPVAGAPTSEFARLGFSLMAAAGVALIAAGLGQRRKSRLPGGLAGLGLLILYLGSFLKFLRTAVPDTMTALLGGTGPGALPVSGSLNIDAAQGVGLLLVLAALLIAIAAQLRGR